ncbi:hypothetical protein [Seonamhaeicola sp.]|uniref:hypothetical protein n=1 Tax=Seonamhaeicola sp. TaxID=1912245 RepID=UPI00356549E5
MRIEDINGNVLKKGDIIDIKQTVNGCNLFYIQSMNPLDIRYGFDFSLVYEYDKLDLISPSKLTGLVEFEIVNNEENFCKTLN